VTKSSLIFRVVSASMLAAGVAASASAAQADAAKTYPAKPIRFIVPFAPGGGTDLTGRTIALKLTERWGQQVVVDNRTGAAGAIGVEITSNATPDGYTLCLISASHTVNAAVNTKLPYDLVKDLQAVSQATSLFYVVTVNPALPIKSVKELIAYAKANPAKLNFGSASVAAAAAGETHVGFTTLTSARPHMKSGRLRALAITDSKRSPAAPELPTVAEAGLPGYEVDQWYGVITSGKVDPAIVRKLAAAIADAVRSPDVEKRLAADGSTPAPSSPADFGKHVQSEIDKWRALVKAAGLQMQ
jgi:tripartite-type tricarboxylate transporter receptor subunit TctC